MKDQQLFDLIKKVVKEKKAFPHPQTMNFAQKYCKQQMIRKKLNPHKHNEKMNHLMKNFTNLETYIDLPDLLNSIKLLKNQQTTQKQNKKPLPIIDKNIQKNSKNTDNLNTSMYLNHKKKIRFFNEEDPFTSVLENIENVYETNEQNLKNNSSYNLSNLFKQAQQEQIQQKHLQENRKLYEKLNKIGSGLLRIDSENEQIGYQQSQLNSKSKKEESQLLHKVSSYLQIILETEHRNKWGVKKHKTTYFDPNLTSKSFNKTLKSRLQPIKQKKKPPLSSYKQKHLLPNFLKDNKDKNNNSDTYTQDLLNKIMYESKQLNKNNQYNKSKQSNQSKQSNSKKQKIKETFTFRRRSIKQKILKDIDTFLVQVDQLETFNRKQNKYYYTQINKIEGSYKRLYGRYRRQTLAGEKDIKNLNELASKFQIKNLPSKQISKIISSVSNEGSSNDQRQEKND